MAWVMDTTFEQLAEVAYHARRSRSPKVRCFWERWLDRRVTGMLRELLVEFQRRGFTFWRVTQLNGETYLALRPPPGCPMPELRLYLEDYEDEPQ